MTLLGGCNAVELEKLLLVVGLLEGVEVLVAGVVEVVVTGVRLTLETPKSGVLGVDGSGVDGVEAAFVMAVLELGVLDGATTGMLEGGVTPVTGGGVMLEVRGVTALALTTPMVVLVGVNLEILKFEVNCQGTRLRLGV